MNDEPYIDSKVACTNGECSATFTMRLERGTPFACEKCGRWQQAAFPCPLCGSPTIHSIRSDGTWVQLPSAEHEHEDPEPQPEPEHEQPEPEPEPAPTDEEHHDE